MDGSGGRYHGTITTQPVWMQESRGTPGLVHSLGGIESVAIKQTNVPPYHPQANPVERVNQTLKTMISNFLTEDHRDWDVHHHEYRHAINTGVQASTLVSPAFLNFGKVKFQKTRPGVGEVLAA